MSESIATTIERLEAALETPFGVFDGDEVATDIRTLIAAIRTQAPDLTARAGVAGGWKRQGVYVASRASVPERAAMWRRLRANGVPIISTWIDEAGEGETNGFGERWARNLAEVPSAERLIAYLEPGDMPVRGVLVEIGAALAAGVRVFIVAPDIELSGPSMRPLGSWLHHPLVMRVGTVEAALSASPPPPGSGELREKAIMVPLTTEMARATADLHADQAARIADLQASLTAANSREERLAERIEAQVPITRAYLIDNKIDPHFADVLLSHYSDIARDALAALQSTDPSK